MRSMNPRELVHIRDLVVGIRRGEYKLDFSGEGKMVIRRANG